MDCPDCQPSPTPQADSAQDEPLQAFDSPRAQALMRAWEEGWAACRDAEYVGEEAQNDAFNSSHTLTLCIAEDQQLPAPQADSQPAPIDMVLHCPACGLQHIDVAEVGPKVGSHHCTRASPDGCEECDAAEEAHREWLSEGPWLNPPHRSHLCHGCGHIWRPADVPTNGVAAVKTTGKADSPIAARGPADSVTAPAGGAVAAHRVMRKRLDGEWVCDGRYWCDGPPSKELVDSICADKDRWRVDVAYTTPPAQAADSVLEDAADPLQGAANWLAEAHGQFCVAVLQGCLMIGYNRAKRLHDAAIAARKKGGV